MKFHLNQGDGKNGIRSCGNGVVVVNETRHTSSLIVTPSQLIPDWQPAALADLTAENLATVAQLATPGCVVLLGANEKQPPLRGEWQAPFLEKKAVLEVMNLRAACRTYNILMGDDRAVVAALILPPGDGG